MKTIKLYFSLILVVLVTNSFSQQDPVREKNCHSRDNKTISKTIESESGICSFHGRNPDVVFEPKLRMDYWMIIPFNESLEGNDDSLEHWMIEPFEPAESFQVEGWMAANWI